MKDIRLCPWTLENVEWSKLARVYRHKGFRCWLSAIKKDYPHAPMYKYTLQYPNGYYQKDMDLAEVNNIINN